MPGIGAVNEPPHILLVEDDEDDFIITEGLLKEIFGPPLHLDWAQNWDQGLAAMANENYDVCLLDYRLGGKTRIELTKEALARDWRGAIIILSGDENRETDLEAMRSGAADYLTKNGLTVPLLKRSIRYAITMKKKENDLIDRGSELKLANHEIEKEKTRYARQARELADAHAKLEIALSKTEESERRYKNLAEHDSLTNLPNRAFFRRRLDEAIAQAARTHFRLAVFLIDLDYFKDVNDTFGHPAGDALLVEVASRLKKCLRETDTVVRLGGDEFAIIATNLPHCDMAGVVAAKVVATLAWPFHIEGQEIGNSASVGVALWSPINNTPDSLLKCADIALYQSKAHGRGQFTIYADPVRQKVNTI